jgi:hypothetical protein
VSIAKILREAEIELFEAVSYYEEKNPGLGLDFLTELEKTINTLINFLKVAAYEKTVREEF